MKIRAFTGLGHFLARAVALLLVTLLLLTALPVVGVSARPALSIVSIGVGSQTGALTYGTAGSVTYAVTVTSDTDVPSSTLSASGLPAGATGVFSPNPVSCLGLGCMATSTLTVSTTTAAFAVTAHSFTVDSTDNAVTGSGSLTIGPRPITVTAAPSSKAYDGGLTSSGVPTVTAGSLVNGNTGLFTQAYTTKTVGINKPLMPAGSVSDGNGGLNYAVIFASANTGTITALGLTISGATAVGKVYDGLLTTTMDGSPALVGVVSGDSVNLNTAAAAATFATEHVGTAKPVTVTGYALTAGGDSANYTLAQPTGITANITARPITVTAVATTKVYDGTNTSVGVPTITVGTLASGDTATWTQTYDTKNVGAANKTINPAGVVSDGNAGADYAVTLAPVANGTITARAITVTAVTNTKTYDGNTTAAAIPTNSGLAPGTDVAAFTEAYLDKTAVAGKTLTPSGLVTDGNSGLNYAYTYTSISTGVINKLALTITGAAVVGKQYDGTATATLGGSPVLVGVVSGDTDVVLGATPAATFVDKNVGPSKPVTITSPGYVLAVTTNSTNYTLTPPTGLTGAITAKPITVTALTNTKIYDGLLTAAAIPTNSGLAPGTDVAAFTEAYSDKNSGTNTKTLVPSGTVTDGSAGLNYAYTFVNFTTGTISQKPLTVTAVANTKVYDGLLTAATLPLNSGLATGDTAPLLIETYADKNFGVGNKTLTPSGLVTDGNSGLNYTYTYTPIATGTINKRPLTVTAITNSRVYNGTTAAAAIPTFPALGAGDTASFIEAYSDKNVGTGNKILIPSGTVTDGNTGLNYALTFVNFTTGTITKAPLTITAKSFVKPFGTAFTFLGTEFTTGTVFHGDFVNSATIASDGAAIDAAVNPYPITISGAVGTGVSNYNLSYVTGTMTVSILPTPPSITEGAATTVAMSVNANPTAFSLTLHATDPNGDPLTWSILTPSTHGAASILGTNPGNSMAIGYIPTPNFLGIDSFVVKVWDGTAVDSFDTITVTVAVNPITATFASTAASDGWVLESGENTNIGSLLNTASTTFAVGDDVANKQYRSILSFNTFLIPDNAVITSATLSIRRQGVVGLANPFPTLGNILVDIKKGNFGTPVLQATDFQVAASKNSVLSFANTLANAWYFRPLAAANLTFINKFGNTQFRLRFTNDDNNNHKGDYLLFWSGNAPVGSAPVLTVQYYLP